MKEIRSFVLGKTGKVSVEVLYRRFTDAHGNQDEGVAVKIFGETMGQSRERLRYDLFKKDPHWHRFGLNGEDNKIGLTVADLGGLTKDSLSHLDETLRSDAVGCPHLADELSEEDLAVCADRIVTAIQEVEREALVPTA